jgi:N-acetylneuraminic acid mutarotase
MLMMNIKQIKRVGSIAALSSLLTAVTPQLALADDTAQLPSAAAKWTAAGNEANFSSDAKLHAPLPEALTSFGATVVDDYLYVFSGHGGGMHGFGKDLLVNHFRRIRYDDPSAKWEELAMHESAQSPGLINDGRYIYRIGGLSFRNSGENAETDFDSTTYFARYDIEANQWTELEPLPQPRSSLDAAILGRQIYVAGGWNLQGASSSDAPWHQDMLMFDLDQPEQGWKSLPGPGYNIRAISLAAHDGKIYLIGGIQNRGMSRKVMVFDPETTQWHEGPELNADSPTAGFATGSFDAGGHLYVTGSSGVVYRLSQDGTAWEVADRLLFPRMFLRLLPLSSDRLIALGGTGSSGSGRLAVVESLRLNPTLTPAPKQVAWSVAYPGRAKHSQTLVLEGHKLYAFGGNASWAAHDFSKEAFVDEAFVFDIASQTVEALPAAPRAFQSAAGVVNRQTSEHKAMALLGGLGITDEKFGSLSDVMLFDPETKSWSEGPSQLPQPRGMFDAVTHADAIWFFGGSDSGHHSQLADVVLHWWGDTTAIAPLPDVDVPHPRRSFGGAVIGEEYFMVGGLGKGNAIVDTVDSFNFETRQWRTIASPNVARVFPSLCSDGTRLYLFGGFSNGDGHFAECSTLEVYDSETNQWSVVADAIPGVAPSMRMLNMNGRLLFFGIDRDASAQANLVLYDPDPAAIPPTVETMSFAGRSRSSEVETNAKMMMRRDANKDGKLSSEELGSRFADFVRTADQDQDGLVSFSELKDKLKADEEAEKEEAEKEEAEKEEAEKEEAEKEEAEK